MNTAKIITENNHQIVILPEEYHMPDNEVYIKKIGNVIILISKDQPWQSLFNSLDLFSEDFLEDRKQPTLQTRKDFLE
jgi:antitoxin VapB